MNQDTSQENSEPNAFWRSRYSIGCVGAQFDAYAAHTSRFMPAFRQAIPAPS